jgi:putative CocE/NonD family hydrolase
MLGLPRLTGAHMVATNIDVPTRDGTTLRTDHYWPSDREADATILIRTPYGRGFPGNLAYGATFAEAGYHVVLQSVRGTHGSSGSFAPFVHEADDAVDAVDWLRQQGWFNGVLATVGGSYLGYAQWALQQAAPKELKASVIIVGPHNPVGMIYPSGAFALAEQFAWSEGVSSQDQYGRIRSMMRLLSTERRHAKVLDQLPLAATADTLAGNAPWYRDWLAHSDLGDPYWAPYRPGDLLDRTGAPTLLVGGWDDAFLDQTLEQYDALHRAGRDAALVVGPWNHMQTAAKAIGELTRLTADWFDEHVRPAAEAPTPHRHPARVFVIGADEWREFESWPPETDDVRFHLDADGRLSSEPGEGASSFTYDPADPTPALGGRILSPRGAGSRNNRSLERRVDVVAFTSDPLPAPMELLGAPVLELELDVDNPHADVFARVCAVDKRGISRNISDGFIRLDPSQPVGHRQHITFDLDARAHRLPAGTRIRLQLSGGAHPRWARNLGTADPIIDGVTRVASHHRVSHSGTTLTLPLRTVQ